MHVLIQAEIFVASVGLRVCLRERRDLGLVNPHRVRFFVDHGGKAVQCLVIVVFADTRVVLIVPPVHTADEVLPIDMAVREQRTPVMTTPIQHGDSVVEADHHEVYVRHQCVCGLSVSELTPDSHSCPGSVHVREIHLDFLVGRGRCVRDSLRGAAAASGWQPDADRTLYCYNPHPSLIRQLT